MCCSKLIFIFSMFFTLSLFNSNLSFSQDQVSKMDMTSDSSRQKEITMHEEMIKMHQGMLECLKGKKSKDECHEEMKAKCPMMGKMEGMNYSKGVSKSCPMMENMEAMMNGMMSGEMKSMMSEGKNSMKKSNVKDKKAVKTQHNHTTHKDEPIK